MSVNSPADKTLRMLSSSWITQNCRVSFGLSTHRLSETCIPLKQICGISSQAWANSVLSGRQIGLRADRDIEGDAGVMTATAAEETMIEATGVRGHLDGTAIETEGMIGTKGMTTAANVHHAKESHVVAKLLRSLMLKWMLSKKR